MSSSSTSTNSLLLNEKDVPYAAWYCEENVYQLAEKIVSSKLDEKNQNNTGLNGN